MPAAKRPRAKPEKVVLNEILNDLARPGIRSARFNSGQVKTENGTWVKLAPPGFSDVAGTESVVITADMVGKTFARAFFIETKRHKGKRRQLQENFIRAMRVAGAKAGFAESVEDARAILKQD
jgi:hypothetical protein